MPQALTAARDNLAALEGQGSFQPFSPNARIDRVTVPMGAGADPAEVRRMLASLTVGGSSCDHCGARRALGDSTADAQAGASPSGGPEEAAGVKLLECQACESAW